jgi:DNA-binding NtrC family response regulator
MEDRVSHDGVASIDVLLVDDEAQVLQSTSTFLRSSGISSVQTLQDGRELQVVVSQSDVGVLVLDLHMPHISGVQLLDELIANHPDLPVIVMTATNEVDTAVACMRSGAADYLVKPVDGDRLLGAVRRGLELRALRLEVFHLRESLHGQTPHNPEAFSEIVTQDPGMLTIFRYIEAVARSPQPVLITGESGTGKELVAKALHRLSGLPGKFIAVNVAGLDDNLFADTLFGHVKGSFTGADRMRDGLVSAATGGTLLLDEIGDLSMASQIKLLRLIQDGTYYPVGSDAVQRSKARILVSTNCAVGKDVTSGKFRKDLYFRLRTHQVELPPLRQRLCDLPLLLDYFVTRAAERLAKPKLRIPKGLVGALETYSWPGNVRELEGMCFDAVARTDTGQLSPEGFLLAISKHSDCEGPTPEGRELTWPQDHLPTLELAEASLVSEALQRVGGNQTLAAELLGISRQALNKRLSRRKIPEYGLAI